MESNKELDIARFIVEKTDNNLFLTGKAGTGKTAFLRDVTKYTKKKHVVLAPTGLAAVNAGGMTIHSFFQFGVGPYIKGVCEPKSNYHIKKQKLELIRNLDLIVIDEISMVRADLLDHINDELQRIRRNQVPFGGVQLLMIGDLQQLPPITSDDETELLTSIYRSKYFFDSLALLNTNYCCIELKKVYRQCDQIFIDILNRARAGGVTLDDIAQLNSRYICDFQPEPRDHYVRLVTHNWQAKEINAEEMSRLTSRVYTFDARVSREFPQDSFPANVHLALRRGSQVMFIKNDPNGRFVNGTLGEVVSLNYNKIKVKLSDSGQLIDVKQATWESLRYKLNAECEQIETEVKGSFKQFPLTPAWAITVHKSQGLTFDKAVIDIHGAFAPGQAYVALSRCRNLDGIVFKERVTPNIFFTDPAVDGYIMNAVQDIDILAENIRYEYFDYDRNAQRRDIVESKLMSDSNEKKRTYDKKTTTRQISYEMFRSGKTVQEIAQERCLAVNTILGHLSNYVSTGDLEVTDFITNETLDKVTAFKQANPASESLKDIFVFFNGEITYGEICIALAYLENRHL